MPAEVHSLEQDQFVVLSAATTGTAAKTTTASRRLRLRLPRFSALRRRKVLSSAAPNGAAGRSLAMQRLRRFLFVRKLKVFKKRGHRV